VFEKKLEVPEKEPVDYVVSVVKATVAAIPKWWAAPAAEVVGLILGSPVERRRDEFLEDVLWVVQETAARVEDLQPEKLAQNEAFVSATMQAVQIAMKTHRKEKRESLRNALLHIALSKSIDEEKQMVFWGLIDALSVTQLELLNLFCNRGSYPPGRLNQLREQSGLTDPMVLDLNNRGLLSDPRPYAARNREPIDSLVLQGWTLTALGKEFLSFIAAPEQIHA